MALAFFDLDGTLLHGPSSEKRFVWHLIKNRHLKWPQILAAIGFILRNFPKLKGNVLKKNKAYLSGLQITKIQTLAENFARNHLLACIQEKVLDHLRRHQKAGDIAILLTGAPDFIAKPLAEHFGFHSYFATVPATCKGRYSPQKPHQHPFGREKLNLAKKISLELGHDLSQATAYADSIHDLHLLREVGRPILVCPCPSLRRLGKNTRWPVL